MAEEEGAEEEDAGGGQIREAGSFYTLVSTLFPPFPLLRARPRIAASYVPFRASFFLAVNRTTCPLHHAADFCTSVNLLLFD